VKAFVETYGCASNQADSQIIIRILQELGVETVKHPAKADWIFLNTCCVKQRTENRMVSRIHKLAGLGKNLVVCGCLPRINPEAARKAGKLAGHCFLLDTNSLDKIPRLLNGEEHDFFSPKHLPKLSMLPASQGLVAVIPACEGCLGNCSFCCTRHARGSLSSHSIKDVRLAVKNAVKNGAMEIRLTGEDVGVYGWDTGTDLASLLRELTAIKGEFRIRVGMMDPFAARKQGDKLVKAFDSPRVYAFAHLPVQSGSDDVLRVMNRKYTVAQFKEVVNAFRKRLPGVSIATDIIVGFPGETDEDFQATLALLERVKPDVTNVSMFYPRPRTPAKRLELLPTEVVKERSRQCSELCSRLSLEQNRRHVGREYKVRVLEKGRKGGFIARLPNYKQLVLKHARLGQELRVLVTRAHSRYLEGKKTRAS